MRRLRARWPRSRARRSLTRHPSRRPSAPPWTCSWGKTPRRVSPAQTGPVRALAAWRPRWQALSVGRATRRRCRRALRSSWRRLVPVGWPLSCRASSAALEGGRVAQRRRVGWPTSSKGCWEGTRRAPAPSAPWPRGCSRSEHCAPCKQLDYVIIKPWFPCPILFGTRSTVSSKQRAWSVTSVWHGLLPSDTNIESMQFGGRSGW